MVGRGPYIDTSRQHILAHQDRRERPHFDQVGQEEQKQASIGKHNCLQ
jgi:hypothetical protein